MDQPISVNFFFSRVCNYSCKFCFHYNNTNFHLKPEEVKKGLRALREAGMKKITFSGGEPFMYPTHLHNQIKYCKIDLGLESVNIVSNGSLISEERIAENEKFIDMLTISCDSFNRDSNILIGRGKGNQVKLLENSWGLCNKYNVVFKINTVVNRYNYQEKMVDQIIKLNPFRWKCFQTLLIKGENIDPLNNSDVASWHINESEFEVFKNLNQGFNNTIFETNQTMRNSYYLVDEKMRFLDCSTGYKIPSRSILEVGVEEAMKQIYFDEEQFFKRKGIYEWSKEKTLCSN